MATPIGRAVIIIEADATKFTGDLNSKLSAEGVKAGDAAGKKTGWTFMRGVAANLVSNVITKAAGAAGNLASSAFSLGFGRLVAIDDARGKLRGLGHDAGSVDLIMKSALNSVKGTAFGLGEAAGLAATAVASGIRPGIELENRLKLTGDAATIAGVSLSEMGSIFGKVQTSQRAYTAELNQLADRGIPIYQWLQEELGVSAEALRDMVSKGQVDSATFFNVIQKNIGGAALEAGTTFSGSLQNVQAAIGRLGAAFLEPVFERMPGVFASIIDALDRIAPAAEIVGNAVGSAFAGLIDILGQVAGFIGDHPVLFGILAAAVLGGAAAFTAYTLALKAWWVITVGIPAVLTAAKVAVIAFNAALRANPIGLVITLIGALVGVIIYLWQNNETFRRIVTAAWNGIKAAVGAVVTWFTDTVAPFFVGLWGRIAGEGGGPNIFIRAWEGIKDFFQGLWDGIVAGVTWFTDLVVSLFLKFHPVGLIITHWESITAFFTTVWGSIVATFQGALDWIVGTFGPAFMTVARIIGLPFELGYKVMAAIAILIVRGLQALADFATGVFAAAWGLLQTYIVTPVANALAALRPLWNAIVTGFTWVKDLVVAAINLLAQLVIAAWNFLSTNVMRIVTAVVNWVVTTFNWWRDTINAIVTVIRDWVVARWTELSSLVTGVVTALVNWVITHWTTFRDNITRLTETIRDWIVERFTALRTKAEEIFDNMVKGIGRIWEGLKAVASAPVKFVIETVLNDGLIAGWNWLVDKLKLPDSLNIAKIPLPSFITGGVMPGPGTSTGDDLVVMNRHGQGVATVASGEPILSRDAYARNRAAVNAMLAGATLPGFFQGGTMPTSAGAINRHPHPYYNTRWAGDMPRPANTPVFAWHSGTVAQIQRLGTSYGHNIIINHAPDIGRSRYAHLLPGSIAVAVGQAVSAGMRIAGVGTTGNSSGNHLHFEIIGGNQPIGADDGGDSGGPGLFAMAASWVADKLTGPVRAALDKIPGDTVFTDAAKGVGNMLLDKAVEKITSLFPSSDLMDASMSGAVASGSMDANSRLILAAAKDLGMPLRAATIALMTVAQESSAGTNRTAMTRINKDGDVGWYQQRATRGDGGLPLGSQAAIQRLADPLYSTRVFYRGVTLGPGTASPGWHVPGLVNKNWQNMGMGQAAQAVQVSAFPSAYDKWTGWAQRMVAAYNYDGGGWLMPGTTAARNDSGRPEPVLTGSQWDNVQGILAVLERQQTVENKSKRGEINVDVTYAPVLREGDDPKRQYETFLWDFVDDVAGVLNRG